MYESLFFQIHTLTSYPGSLLNRDDVGFAKRLPFGGVTRTRISSQCLKRHWRRFEGEHGLSSITADAEPVPLSIRSRLTFDRFVLEPLTKEGVAPELARAATEAVMAEALGESAKAKKAREEARGAADVAANGGQKGSRKPSEEKAAGRLETSQVTVLGRAELDFFLAEARALAEAAKTPEKMDQAKKARFTKDWTKNLSALKRAAGLDAALFGRMVTSDRLARTDAAVQVAHAFTVHAEQVETDYFTAVDDLLARDDGPEEQGSAHIGSSELTSGLFYGYVVVDVPLLVSNLEGCRERDWKTADRKLAADVVSALVNLITRVSPGAKLGSTAPYAYSHLALVEVGQSQPRTLANAFLNPVRATSQDPDILRRAYRALASYVSDVDSMFGLNNRRALAAIGPKDALEPLGSPGSLDSVAKFAAGSVLEGA